MPGTVLCVALLLAASAPLNAGTKGADDGVEPVASHGQVIDVASGGVDPSLTWNTFLGGSEVDEGAAIAVDRNGDVYVTGSSFTTWENPLRPHTAGSDAFVAKLTSGGKLVWSTFLGGSGDDFGEAIAVDGSGNVYVAGSSAAAWGNPVADHAAGTADAFAAKLNADGTLSWNTFLGGTDNDQGFALALDDSGVYVTGSSFAPWGNPVREYTGSIDAFAARLNTNGALVWNTFLGGSDGDQAFAIATDGSGNAYIAGNSVSAWGAPVRDYTASNDAFVAAVAANGTLSWTTFLGGSGDDSAEALLLDGGGNLYLAGHSTNTWEQPERAFTAGTDAFAARLAVNGKLTWNTFLGGSGDDSAASIAFDGSDIFIAGHSTATWDNSVLGDTNAYDAFVARVTTGGKLGWNRFLGGEGVDVAYAVAVDGAEVHVTGHSQGTWSDPVRACTPSPEDAFVVTIPVDSSSTPLLASTSGTARTR